MTKYRKKPIIIEAEKFDGWPADNSQWVRDAISRTTEMRDNGSVAAVFIQILEGEMRADRGDWIIRGVKGECYPCKPDIFEATYDPRPMTPDPIRAALARQALAELAERALAAAVEVLRPFAVEADVWPSNYNDDDELVEPFGDYSGELNVGALRAARQFVKEHGK